MDNKTEVIFSVKLDYNPVTMDYRALYRWNDMDYGGFTEQVFEALTKKTVELIAEDLREKVMEEVSEKLDIDDITERVIKEFVSDSKKRLLATD